MVYRAKYDRENPQIGRRVTDELKTGFGIFNDQAVNVRHEVLFGSRRMTPAESFPFGHIPGTKEAERPMTFVFVFDSAGLVIDWIGMFVRSSSFLCLNTCHLVDAERYFSCRETLRSFLIDLTDSSNGSFT